jgi:hypothetical protein
MIIYTVTPLLGALRNYVKYKQFKLMIFIKTPITYFIIHKLLEIIKCRNIILYTLILERWYFLLYKTVVSLINDDYNIKKQKYIIKYNLKYI